MHFITISSARRRKLDVTSVTKGATLIGGRREGDVFCKGTRAIKIAHSMLSEGVEVSDNLSQYKRAILHSIGNRLLGSFYLSCGRLLELVPILDTAIDGFNSIGVMPFVEGVEGFSDVIEIDRKLSSIGLSLDDNDGNVIYSPDGKVVVVLEVFIVLHPEVLLAVECLNGDLRNSIIKDIARAHLLGLTAGDFDWNDGSNIDNFGISRKTFEEFSFYVEIIRPEIAQIIEFARKQRESVVFH